MKILHIGNTAGIATQICKNMRKKGHKCDTMIFYPDTLNQGCDFNYSVSSRLIRLTPLFQLYRVARMLQHIKDYDIIHFHAFGGITFQMDYILWKPLGKKIVLHYHGSELRRFKTESPFATLADMKYVSTPDLLQYCDKEAVWLPTPIDIMKYDYVGLDYEPKLTIVHAVVSLEHGMKKKGTDIILKAVEIVKQRGYDFDFKLFCGIPHADLMQEIKNADIVIGQTKIGWYGSLELEAMAMGKPVISYIDNQYLPGANVYIPPIYPILKDDPVSTANAICELIESRVLRNSISHKGRHFVEQWHGENENLYDI